MAAELSLCEKAVAVPEAPAVDAVAGSDPLLRDSLLNIPKSALYSLCFSILLGR